MGTGRPAPTGSYRLLGAGCLNRFALPECVIHAPGFLLAVQTPVAGQAQLGRAQLAFGVDPGVICQPATLLQQVAGRLEQLSSNPVLLVDAAHNPHGVAALAGAVGSVVAGRRLVGLVAALADKDARGIVEGLAPLVDVMVVTHTSSPRALSAEELWEIAVDVAGHDRVILGGGVQEALSLARAHAGEHGAVLATGSITLVSEVRALTVAVESSDADPSGEAQTRAVA